MPLVDPSSPQQAFPEASKERHASGVVDLSVVVIAHNEEETIVNCLESAIKASEAAKDADLIGEYELLLVDAASRDGTLRSVSELPVGIVRIPPEMPHGPGAARFVGFHHTRGRLVLFLDGDSVLDQGWLLDALAFVGHTDAAGVDGNLVHAISPATSIAAQVLEAARAQSVQEPSRVDVVGQAIFRREVLEAVGPHDPFLRGGEDRELSQRLRNAGFALYRIPRVSVSHYWGGSSGVLTPLAHLRSAIAWSYGDGQSIRRHSDNPLVRREQRERYFRWRTIVDYENLLLFTVAILAVTAAFVATPLFFVVSVTSSLIVLEGLSRIVRTDPERPARSALWKSIVTLVRHVALFAGILLAAPRSKPFLLDGVERLRGSRL